MRHIYWGLVLTFMGICSYIKLSLVARFDKFHEALINRFTKKALAAAIIIMLFAFWYVAATYREYDEWRYEDSWAIMRRVIIIDGQLVELNISFGQFAIPLKNGINMTTMIYSGNSTRNGHSVYWENACMADAQFQAFYHVKEFLGHAEYGMPIDHKVTMHYYYTLLCQALTPGTLDDLVTNHSSNIIIIIFGNRDDYMLPTGATMEPEELRAYEEFHIDFLKLLHEIALNKLAEVYRGLMSQETMIIQGREYPADFRGDGYIGENEYPWLNG